ncbi:MAG: dihydrofolate reductase family protein, partial [Acidovorax sp.]|nr:dihydrofolate reductase family protein [Acidovorax sp.]
APSPKPPPPTPYRGLGGEFEEKLVAQASRLCSSGPHLKSDLPSPGSSRGKDPIRIVLDSRLRLPLTARLLHLESAAPTWVACTPGAPKEKIKALKKLGVEVLVLPQESAESSRVALKPLLELLGKRQVQSLLVEGGAETLGAFFDQRLVDKFYFFYAPKFLGGQDAPGVLGGQGFNHLKDAPQAKGLTLSRLGPDILISGYL